MLTITPSSKWSFLAEVTGVDLRDCLDADTFQAILDAWVNYPVMVFPDQDVAPDEQQAFAARFGALVGRTRPKSERGKDAQDNPYVMVVSNIRDEHGAPLGMGDYELAFHSDGCFQKVPTLATFLYGIEVPKHGGETLFVDMNEVYGALSSATRERIPALQGVNYHASGYRKHQLAGDLRPPIEVVVHAIHPLVIGHPINGKPIVYANRNSTHDIAGMERANAKPILDEIFAAIEEPTRVYAHRWRKGELVMWDNRAVQHARAYCAPEQRRMLRRFAVEASEAPRPYRQPAIPQPAE